MRVILHWADGVEQELDLPDVTRGQEVIGHPRFGRARVLLRCGRRLDGTPIFYEDSSMYETSIGFNQLPWTRIHA